MSTQRIAATVAATLAAAVLTAAPAAAGATSEPARALSQAVAEQPAPNSSSLPTIGPEPLDPYSDYPGGAAGNSNGELTAGQKGEPLGAGGTSGGSSSPFARNRA